MYKGSKVAVLIPAYYEERLIGETLAGVPDYVDEIHVVDDASTDGTSQTVLDHRVDDPRIVLHRHEVNEGVGGAILTAMRAGLASDGDLFAVLAGDNQMDPAFLPAVLDPLVAGHADITKGNRLARGLSQGMGGFRLFGNVLLTALTWIASGYWHVRDPQNGYVAFTRRAAATLSKERLRKDYEFENDVMVEANLAGLRMVNVPIPARYGTEVSGIRYGRFIRRTSLHLLYAFLRRVWLKYARRGHPLALLYYAGTGLIIALPLTIWFTPWWFWGIGPVSFVVACAWESFAGRPREATE